MIDPTHPHTPRARPTAMPPHPDPPGAHPPRHAHKRSSPPPAHRSHRRHRSLAPRARIFGARSPRVGLGLTVTRRDDDVGALPSTSGHARTRSGTAITLPRQRGGENFRHGPQRVAGEIGVLSSRRRECGGRGRLQKISLAHLEDCGLSSLKGYI